MRILFVCLGNICRSPAADGMLRHMRPDWSIDSAGTASWHIGKPPYDPMRAAARLRGIDLDDLRARQVRPADFAKFDVVVAMDADNLADLRAMPGGEKAVLFGEATGLGAVDVPDPYYTRDFEGCLDMIEDGLTRFVASRTSWAGRGSAGMQVTICVC